LLSEPVLVFHGDHREDFELLGQQGAPIGSAVRVSELKPAWALRETTGRDVVVVRRRRRIWGTGWKYAVCDPDGAEIATIRRQLHWGNYGRVATGDRTIGHLRLRVWRRAGATIEDHTGRTLIRLRPVSGLSGAVTLVAAIEDQAPEEMRRVMLATALIYDWQCVTRNRGE
jgi:hypothetical protein